MSRGYAEIVAALEDVPISRLPALLVVITNLNYQKGALVPGGASHIVRNIEKKLGKSCPDCETLKSLGSLFV